MPKLPIDYSKTLIYKIEHIQDDNLLYVGHTTNWDKRKCKHKNACNLKLCQMIRENGGWEMFQLIEVEKYPCNDKREAERRENEIMKELKATMNMKKSFLTAEESIESDKQYRENNKDKIKEYYENNEEKISEGKKENYEKNKEKMKERDKQYRENNKDKIKEYYENNKEKFKERE